MAVVVYVEKKRVDFPGHLVVGQEDPNSLPRYYGYLYDPADIPAGSYKGEAWVTYISLNSNERST